MKHLLVTNDFPPKVGGIQNYLWELWRRLPPESFCVLTRPHQGDKGFDSKAAFKIIRSRQKFLLPTPSMGRDIKKLAEAEGCDLVILDPALPLGNLGPKLGLPYGLVIHGAEVNVPAKIPGLRSRLIRTIKGAEFVISASDWASNEIKKVCAADIPYHYIPPGVDVDRFTPFTSEQKLKIRNRLGIKEGDILVTSISRLVPRKGMDRLIKAVRILTESPKEPQNVSLLIGGTGRDKKRLKRLVGSSEKIKLLGRLSEVELTEIYAVGDIFAMPCRSRWGGLEQEGFGIVFMEAAACGVPVVAGESGGAPEAVLKDKTGLLVSNPESAFEVSKSLDFLIKNPEQRNEMSKAARKFAVEGFSYDLLAEKLQNILKEH